jgi:hypothetical protein
MPQSSERLWAARATSQNKGNRTKPKEIGKTGMKTQPLLSVDNQCLYRRQWASCNRSLIPTEAMVAWHSSRKQRSWAKSWRKLTRICMDPGPVRDHLCACLLVWCPWMCTGYKVRQVCTCVLAPRDVESTIDSRKQSPASVPLSVKWC